MTNTIDRPATRKPPLTTEAVAALPANVPLREAARAIGISDKLGYRLAADDDFPLPVIRISNRMYVAKARILQYLDMHEDERAPAAPPPPQEDRKAILDALQEAADALDQGAAAIRKAMRRMGR